MKPEEFISELSSVLLVNTYRGGLTGLYHCRHTKSLSCFTFTVSLLYQTGMFHQATSGSRSLILLVVSQQTSCQSLHAFCGAFTVFYSFTLNAQSSKFWQRISLSPYCQHWQLDDWSWRVWIISKVPLTPQSSTGYKLNRSEQIPWTMQIIASYSPCSNYPICRLRVV